MAAAAMAPAAAMVLPWALEAAGRASGALLGRLGGTLGAPRGPPGWPLGGPWGPFGQLLTHPGNLDGTYGGSFRCSKDQTGPTSAAKPPWRNRGATKALQCNRGSLDPSGFCGKIIENMVPFWKIQGSSKARVKCNTLGGGSQNTNPTRWGGCRSTRWVIGPPAKNLTVQNQVKSSQNQGNLQHAGQSESGGIRARDLPCPIVGTQTANLARP